MMMDIFDEMFSKEPKEHFVAMLKSANSSAIEKAFESFLSEHIAMFELLEKMGVTEAQIKEFEALNDDLITQRKNDIYIGLTAQILGQEG